MGLTADPGASCELHTAGVFGTPVAVLPAAACSSQPTEHCSQHDRAGRGCTLAHLQQGPKILMVLRLEVWQAWQLLGHIKLLFPVLLRDLVPRRHAVGRGRCQQLARWRPDGSIPIWRVQDLVTLCR